MADLLNSILAVVHPYAGVGGDVSGDMDDSISHYELKVGSTLPDCWLAANVAGFVSVSKIDVENNSMIVYAPCGGKLPSKFLVAGSIVWKMNE